MKKYIIKISLFLIPILLFPVLIEVSVRNIPNNYKFKKEYLDRHSNEIKILVMGHSQTLNGINPEYFTDNCYNTAFSAQSLKYDFRILDRYKSEFDSLKYVIVPISYFSLFYKLETGISSYLLKNYELYLEVAKSKKISDKYEVLSLNINNNIKRIKNYYMKRKNPISCDENGWEVNEKRSDLKETASKSLKRHNEYIEYGIEHHLSENILHLKNIVKLCHDIGAEVIFVTPPSYSTYSSEVLPDYLDITLETMNELTYSYENCRYLNMLKDSMFVAEDYSDASHLNKIGARKLSITLDQYLNNRE